MSGEKSSAKDNSFSFAENLLALAGNKDSLEVVYRSVEAKFVWHYH